jgi:hypothetical protein
LARLWQNAVLQFDLDLFQHGAAQFGEGGFTIFANGRAFAASVPSFFSRIVLDLESHYVRVSETRKL